MKNGNVLLEKSYAFGLRMFGLNKLVISKKLYAAADQVFRNGTSIGANTEEAIGGASRRDFIAKMTIAYEEARETHYWLRLPRDSESLEPRLAASLLADAEGLKKILASIFISSKAADEAVDEAEAAASNEPTE